MQVLSIYKSILSMTNTYTTLCRLIYSSFVVIFRTCARTCAVVITALVVVVVVAPTRALFGHHHIANKTSNNMQKEEVLLQFFKYLR